MFVRIATVILAAIVLGGTLTGTAKAQSNINENQETAKLYVDVVNGNDNNPGT